jgi:hypothetical protein
VLFGDGKAIQITCYARKQWDCDALGGVHIGTEEAEVRRALGDPVKPPKLLENGRKVLTYGAAPNWVRFQLRKQKIEGISISSAVFMQLTPPASFYNDSSP